jgi:membrane-associated phospholipid phosphatase
MKYFSPFVKAHLLFLLLALPLVMLDKGTVELWLNARHIPFLDSFFRYTTVVGDGITAALFALILLTFSYYKTIVYTTAILLNTFLIQGLGKKVLFSHLVRPKNFFPDDVTLNFVENFKTYGYQTFPSGHTGAAFTWLSFLALLLPKKYGLPLFLVALLVGISRVYLLQHFFVDIYAGSIIGTAGVLLSNYYFAHHTTLGDRPSLQKGLIFK